MCTASLVLLPHETRRLLRGAAGVLLQLGVIQISPHTLCEGGVHQRVARVLDAGAARFSLTRVKQAARDTYPVTLNTPTGEGQNY